MLVSTNVNAETNTIGTRRALTRRAGEEEGVDPAIQTLSQPTTNREVTGRVQTKEQHLRRVLDKIRITTSQHPRDSRTNERKRTIK